MNDMYIADSTLNNFKMSDTTLQIEIKNRNPVELLDYTEAMTSLCVMYNKYISLHPELTWEHDARLYIQKVESGSIITKLQDLIPLVFPFAENFNNIIDFSKHLKAILYSAIGKKDENTNEVPTMPTSDVVDLRNAYRIVNPVAKDGGSQLNIGAVNFNGDMVVNISLSSLESNAIQNRINSMIDELKEPIQKFYEKVIFVWYVAKNDVKSQSGDRGIIESISSKPCKVIFVNEKIKSDMIDMEENPLHKAFVVDVEVGTVQLSPVSYKILKMYEYFDY